MSIMKVELYNNTDYTIKEHIKYNKTTEEDVKNQISRSYNLIANHGAKGHDVSSMDGDLYGEIKKVNLKGREMFHDVTKEYILAALDNKIKTLYYDKSENLIIDFRNTPNQFKDDIPVLFHAIQRIQFRYNLNQSFNKKSTNEIKFHVNSLRKKSVITNDNKRLKYFEDIKEDYTFESKDFNRDVQIIILNEILKTLNNDSQILNVSGKPTWTDFIFKNNRGNGGIELKASFSKNNGGVWQLTINEFEYLSKKNKLKNKLNNNINNNLLIFLKFLDVDENGIVTIKYELYKDDELDEYLGKIEKSKPRPRFDIVVYSNENNDNYEKIIPENSNEYINDGKWNLYIQSNHFKHDNKNSYTKTWEGIKKFIEAGMDVKELYKLISKTMFIKLEDFDNISNNLNKYF